MARTRHQIVQKAAIAAAANQRGKKKGAKNSDLRQAAHQGRAPVKDARSAQSGYAAVPVSTATLPPGQGPQMSSNPVPAGRGRNSKGKATNARAAASLTAIQASAAASSAKGGGGGRGASSSRGRGRRKR